MAKRKIYKTYPISKYIIILLFIFLFIGIGFSVFSIDLNLLGNVQLKKYEPPTLCNVLKKEAEVGTYAKRYTGEHKDSFTEAASQNIYYWYGNSSTTANAILDKWNVLFGGFCWQMIRTTDTGGVKLIYNGVPTDGKCNNTGTAQQIGTSKFNSGTNSPANVGYMYHSAYSSQLSA